MNDVYEVDLYEDDEELFTVDNNNDSAKVVNPMELELTGVLLEDEVKYILDIVNRYSNEDSSIPIYIVLEGERAFIGNTDMSYELFLRLYSINKNYSLRLIDNEHGKSKLLLGKDKLTDYKTLQSLITL